MNIPETREHHRRTLRSGILDAAREIFVRDGFDGFSMRTLAKSVGYSPAALYLHFKNKDELFDLLVEESFVQLHAPLEKLQEDGAANPLEQLKRGLRIYVEWGLKHPNEYQIAFVVRSPANKPYRTHQAFSAARVLVKRSFANSGATEREIEMHTQAIWAAIHGVTSLLIQRPNFPWVSRRQLIGQVIENAVCGAIRAKKRKKAKDNHANRH